MDTALSIKNLTKSYGAKNAVNGISFDVYPNEIFALIGPNGAGKTSTIRIVATILSQTSGNVSIYGMDNKKDASKIRQIISYLPEEAGAYKNLRGIEYLRFMSNLFAQDNNAADGFINTAKEICGLGDRLNDKISTYSKGMSRKLLLSRAIMTNPKLAILDEPTSGLDVINAIEIRKTIKNLSTKGMSVLVSSHNMLEIEFLCDRVAIMDKGIIHEIGTPKQLKEKYNAQNLEDVFVEVAK